jgi:Family of unknown function (DUF5519)
MVSLPGLEAIDLATPFPRLGPRPSTTGVEIPHDQLDQFSPPEIRAALIAHAQALPGVFTSPSQVSEPSSLAFRLREPSGPWEAFLPPTRDEFGHVHRSGFLHLTLPLPLVAALGGAGWVEPHPITRRASFPDTIVMLYAPRNDADLAMAVAALRASWEHAAGRRLSPEQDF